MKPTGKNRRRIGARLTRLARAGESAADTFAVLADVAAESALRPYAKLVRRRGRRRPRWMPIDLKDRTFRSAVLDARFVAPDVVGLSHMTCIDLYEPTEWFTPGDGQTVIDVGAHLGAYTIISSRAVGPTGRVIAVEADETNRALLETNIALNELANVSVSAAAAWSERGTVGWAGNSSISRRAASDGVRRVQATTLDDLVDSYGLGRVDWVKIDVEGDEIEVLRGSDVLLRVLRPALFVETHLSAGVAAFLAPYGYRSTRARADDRRPGHGWELLVPPVH